MSLSDFVSRIVRGLFGAPGSTPVDGDTRGIVNARLLGLSKHRHRADPAKKRARRLQRLARREQRGAR